MTAVSGDGPVIGAPGMRQRRRPRVRGPRVDDSGPATEIPGSDPSHRLPGHLGDAVEVGVVVQHRRARSLRGRGDDQVCDLHAPMVQAADMCETPLDLERSREAGASISNAFEERPAPRPAPRSPSRNEPTRGSPGAPDRTPPARPLRDAVATLGPRRGSWSGARRWCRHRGASSRGRLSASSSGDRSTPVPASMRSASRSRRCRRIGLSKRLLNRVLHTPLCRALPAPDAAMHHRSPLSSAVPFL